MDKKTESRFAKTVLEINPDYSPEPIDRILIPTDMLNNKSAIAFRILGSAMEPYFQSNDIVVIREQSILQDGELGCVLIDGDNTTLKKNGSSRKRLHHCSPK